MAHSNGMECQNVLKECCTLLMMSYYRLEQACSLCGGRVKSLCIRRGKQLVTTTATELSFEPVLKFPFLNFGTL